MIPCGSGSRACFSGGSGFSCVAGDLHCDVWDQAWFNFHGIESFRARGFFGMGEINLSPL